MSKNQLLQRDVERFRNRQNFVTQIKHLKMKKCWLVGGCVSESVKEYLWSRKKYMNMYMYVGVYVRACMCVSVRI